MTRSNVIALVLLVVFATLAAAALVLLARILN